MMGQNGIPDRNVQRIFDAGMYLCRSLLIPIDIRDHHPPEKKWIKRCKAIAGAIALDQE